MTVHVTIFFLFFGSLLGILLTFFLARKKLRHSGYIFLFLYFAVLLLQITLKLMSEGWLTGNWRAVHDLSYQLPFLYGPLIYLFARKLLQKEKLHRVDLFHFAPFFLLFFYLMLGYLYDESPTVLFPFLFAKFRLVFQLVSLYVYHWLALQCLKSQTQYIHRYYPAHQFRWIQRFIYVSLVVCIATAVLNFATLMLYPQLNYLSGAFVLLTIFIYWVSYEALNHRDGFFAVKGYGEESLPPSGTVPPLTVHRPLREYSRSSLMEDKSNHIIDGI